MGILEPDEVALWQRQIDIPGFGEKAQEALKKSRVVVMGVGGVGSAAALYLACAGVGSLVLVDKDVVSISNLNRQILYGYADIGQKKVQRAYLRLKEIQPYTSLAILGTDVGYEQAKELLKKADYVIDAFDTNQSRLMVNRVCLELSVPACHGFAAELGCEVIEVVPGKTACLACVIDEDFPEQDGCPVIGVTAGLAGIYMALMAIKRLTGMENYKAGCRLIFDLMLDQFLSIPLEKKTECPVCGSRA